MHVAVYLVICSLSCVFFFFFKQKTAYEMRISDWSSDVCSSDLVLEADDLLALQQVRQGGRHVADLVVDRLGAPARQPLVGIGRGAAGDLRRLAEDVRADLLFLHQAEQPVGRDLLLLGDGSDGLRSEEHTSELQSLMRISYAVL